MTQQFGLNDLKEYFPAIYVVNLPSRNDRWDDFFGRMRNKWPFGKMIRYPATNGKMVPPPKWWTAGPGAWGCYRSHVRIIEECLTNKIDRVLILEDDAFLVDGFVPECMSFLANVPNDWKMLYLGGQHFEQERRLPRKLNDWVYQPYNVNRTHCYAVQGREFMIRLYHHLHDVANWKHEHHVDHHYGELHKKMESGLYAPQRWLVGQAEGASDITNNEERSNLWLGAKQLIESPIQKPMVGVLGAYRGGTSCVTGVLHALGVYVGDKLKEPTKDNPFGFYEDKQLGDLCRNMFEEPWLVRKRNKQDSTNLLRWWAAGRIAAFQNNEVEMIGAKHPILCMLGEELLDAWDQPKFIVVDRPIEDSILSLKKASWGWPSESIEYLIPKMLETRDKFLVSANPDFIRIDFTQLCQQPDQIVGQICDFLGHSPTEEQKQSAIDFVNQG